MVMDGFLGAVTDCPCFVYIYIFFICCVNVNMLKQSETQPNIIIIYSPSVLWKYVEDLCFFTMQAFFHT